VHIGTPFHTSETSFTTVKTGKGTPITSDDQLVVLGITVVSGADGKVLGATTYGDLSQVQPLSFWTKILPGIRDAVQCATPGSRVAVALPPKGLSADSGLSIGEDDSSVAVVDVEKVYLTKADGADQYNAGFGLPVVVRTSTGRPGLIVPDGSAPSDLVVQTLKKGDGAAVTGKDPVRIHALEVTWNDKQVVNTTWDGSPESVDLSSVSPDLAKALKDATVGSQLLVVVPAGKDGASSGDENQAHIYVIDILGLDAAASN
jgi:peptidylprolyl isomerase